jgi:hypothetical protein
MIAENPWRPGVAVLEIERRHKPEIIRKQDEKGIN